MTLYINGSPGLKNSNSQFFINKIKNKNDHTFYLYKQKFNKLLPLIKKSEKIIFSFPLYVDTIPSKMIELMEYIENNNINLKNKYIYVICNSGFLEPYHNNIAIKTIKIFCKNNKARYRGSFKVGAGVIIGKKNKNLIYKLICLPALIKMKKFKNMIKENKSIELSTTICLVTKRMYIYFANISWKKKINKIKE